MKVEHRRDRRSHVFLTAMLRSVAGEHEARVINLSAAGACANCPVALDPGTDIEMSRGETLISGRVAWASDGRVGIEFSEPIDVGAFRSQAHATEKFEAALLHTPATRLSRRMERHWTDIWKC